MPDPVFVETIVRIINVLTLILVFMATYGQSFAYSNLIILGDSLSDIGNFPESSYLFEKTYDDIAQHSYIPATNPVEIAINKTLAISGKMISNPLSNTKRYLSDQPPLAHHQRALRSINWSQYLTHELFGDKHYLLPQTTLLAINDKNISVSYAWWAAVTSEGCFNDNYHRIEKHCQLNKLRQAKKNQNIDDILIPGIISQAQLIQEDIKAKRIFHDKDTLYIIFAGGNGLYQAQNTINEHKLSHLPLAFNLFYGGGSQDIAHAISILSNPPASAKKILVINLYDLKLTPRLVNDATIGTLAHLFVRLYNHRLHNALSKLKKRKPTLSISEFDNYHFFLKLSQSEFFKTSLGKQCDGHDIHSDYYQQATHSHNCFIDTTHGYLYWNNSHPSSLAHALLASALTSYLRGA